MYEFQEFPKWKYRGSAGANGEAVLVNNAEQEAALGDGWADAPSEAPAEPVIDPRDARIAELEAQLAAKAEPAHKTKAGKTEKPE